MIEVINRRTKCKDKEYLISNKTKDDYIDTGIKR